MKLVKIGKFYINPEAIDEIEGNDKETFIGMRSNNSLNVSLPIEKVLQAIEGSQEHKVSSKKYIKVSNLYLRE